MVTHIPNYNGRQQPHNRRIRCSSRYNSKTRTICENKRMLSYNALKDYLNALLEDLLNGSPEAVFGAFNGAAPDALAAKRNERASCERQAKNLIRSQRDLGEDASDAVRQEYNQQLREVNARIAQLDKDIQQHERDSMLVTSELKAQRLALDELREIGLDTFWLKPEREINQLLHRLLLRFRVEVLNGEAVTLMAHR